MNKLTKELVKKNEAPVKVLQFGEGNFMRGFVDWQIQQLNNQQLFKGNVAIIQPLEQGLGNNDEPARQFIYGHFTRTQQWRNR